MFGLFLRGKSQFVLHLFGGTLLERGIIVGLYLICELFHCFRFVFIRDGIFGIRVCAFDIGMCL